MHAQVMIFDGPRSPEAVAASTLDGQGRIAPLVDTHPDLRGVLGGLRALAPDGTEVVVVLAEDEDALASLDRLVRTAELPAGVDRALLSAPDRALHLASVDVFGRLAEAVGAAAR